MKVAQLRRMEDDAAGKGKKWQPAVDAAGAGGSTATSTATPPPFTLLLHHPPTRNLNLPWRKLNLRLGHSNDLVILRTL